MKLIFVTCAGLKSGDRQTQWPSGRERVHQASSHSQLVQDVEELVEENVLEDGEDDDLEDADDEAADAMEDDTIAEELQKIEQERKKLEKENSERKKKLEKLIAEEKAIQKAVQSGGK